MTLPKINSMDQLKELSDEQFVDGFVANINLIFQYNEKDIINTLDSKSMDIVMEIRNKLCNKAKECFPEFATRQPINRKAKHLAISDISYLAKSILRDNALRDVEKMFGPRQDNETEADIMLEDFDANDPVSVANQFRALVSHIVTLKTQLAGFQHPKCQCNCTTEKVSMATTPGHTDNADVLAAVSDADETSTNGETSDEDYEIVLNPKRKKKEKRKAPSHVTPPSPAPKKSQNRDLYVGNVKPKYKVNDIKRHIKNNGVDIPTKDIHQLHKGSDYASFRISLPQNEYDRITKIWSKGIKVRPYTTNQGSRNKQQSGNKGRSARGTFIRSAPYSPRSHNKHSYKAGYSQAMQDARQHHRDNHDARMPSYSPAHGTYHDPDAWYTWQRQYESEWPPLPHRW